MTAVAVPGEDTGTPHEAYRALLERCKSLEPVVTAVAYPCEATALAGCIESAAAVLIAPVLVGPRQKICEVAAEAGLNVSPYPIEDVPDAHPAAAKAVELVGAAQ